MCQVGVLEKSRFLFLFGKVTETEEMSQKKSHQDLLKFKAKHTFSFGLCHAAAAKNDSLRCTSCALQRFRDRGQS